MKFSIITPAYNAEKLIGKAIESVINQTYADWEMIIVNDGSTDNTLHEIERYLKKEPRLRLINCSENSGRPACARNIGLRQARGEYVAFLDADDFFLPEKLSEVERFFMQNPDADLVCHGERHVKNNKVVRTKYYGPYKTYGELLFRGNCLSTSAVVMRKSCIEKVGFFAETEEFIGFEDYDYWLRISKACKIKYLRRILGVYTLLEHSDSTRIATNYKNALTALDFHYSQWKNKSLYYRLLLRNRKASFLKVSSAEFIRKARYHEAASLISHAIIHNSFDLKSWLLLYKSLYGSVVKTFIRLRRKVTGRHD